MCHNSILRLLGAAGLIPRRNVRSLLAASEFGIKEYSKEVQNLIKKDSLNLYSIKRRILRVQLKLPIQIFKIKKR
jgi:hypothetical protein